MPKTKSRWILQHYPPLRDIPEDEWDDVFDRQRKRWSEEEDDYLRQWYGKESTMRVSYALGRCPWSVQDRASSLGLKCDLARVRRNA